MSSWTYVSGLIEVDTFSQTSAETIFKAQTVVEHLPRITGSEGAAHFVVVPMPGWHNQSSGLDELGHFSNLGDKRYSTRWTPFQSQSGALLVLHGSLRDRWFDQTLHETTKCLTRLASRLHVRDCLVRVSGFDRQYIFDSPDWICQMPNGGWKDRLVDWSSVPKSDVESWNE